MDSLDVGLGEHKQRRNEQLPSILRGVYDFYQSKGRLPSTLDETDRNQLLSLIKNEDTGLVSMIGKYAQLQMAPLCSFVGGVISAEVTKIDHKHKPISQWLHL